MKMQKFLKVVATTSFMVFLLMLSTGVSFGVTASLYDSGTGTTTAPSGISTFALDSSTYTVDSNDTVINLNKFDPFEVIAIRINSVTLPSGVTFGQAASTDDGTVEGDAYILYARVGNDPDNVSTGEQIPITPSTKYSSSTTPWIIEWEPGPISYVQFEFLSGVSAVYEVELKFTTSNRKKSPVLIPLSHQTADFAATGTTPFKESFTIPNGCRCVEIQSTSTNWAYSSPTESGVSKIIEENKSLPMPISEIEDGSYGPGAGAAGTINAQFWTECP